MTAASISQLLANRSASDALSQHELSRFSRHILLPEVGVLGQKKLRAARVLVIGTGGLGSPVTLYLAAAGVGTLGIVEFDAVDRTNLQRQILYADADVGRAKIDAATTRLQALYPDIKIEKNAMALNTENAAQIIRKYDLIIDGTDNFATRYLVNDTCVWEKKPNIYGSIFRFDGQASVFYAENGPCYRCLFPSPPPADQVPNCAEGGVLGVLPGLIGMIQATEAVKLILGIGESLIGRLLLFDALSLRFDDLKISKNPDCPTCGTHPTILSPMQSIVNETCSVLPAQQEQKTGYVVHQIAAIDLQTLRQKKIPHVLLDVRAAGEVAICQIQGSLNIPLQELASRHKELSPDELIVVHCKTGGRSQKAVELLQGLGFSKLKNLSGGILKWIQEIDSSLASY